MGRKRLDFKAVSDPIVRTYCRFGVALLRLQNTSTMRRWRGCPSGICPAQMRHGPRLSCPSLGVWRWRYRGAMGGLPPIEATGWYGPIGSGVPAKPKHTLRHGRGVRQARVDSDGQGS